MSSPANSLRRDARPAGSARGKQPGPRWYEVLLGIALLLALVAIAITVAVKGGPPVDAGDAQASQVEWRSGTQATAFLVVMFAGGAIALIAFLVAMVRRGAIRRGTPTAAATGAPAAAEDGDLAVEPRTVPAGARIVGLLLLPVSLLLLAWLALPAAEQRALVTALVYPGAFAIALVLLVDKASRAWHYKTSAEGLREWLLCDLFTFLLALGFLNAWRVGGEVEYGGIFFDLLHVTLFMAVFLLLDRATGRYRFLVGYAYLALLPFLLWGWRASTGVVQAEDIDWSATIWPFVILGVIYFVLEIIALLASRGHAAAAVKDAVAVLVYAGFLIAALPGEA